MRPTDPRLLTALSLAVATGLSLTACDPATPTGPTDTDVDSDTDADTTTDTDVDTDTDADLAAICASGQWLEHVSLASPVDYLELRRLDQYGEPNGTVVTVWSEGTACDTASDVDACEAALATTWPDRSGWGYCGQGCSDSGLVTTNGDTVSLFDSTAEVIGLFGDIDNPADALFVAVTQEYQPDCETVSLTPAGNWQMTADILISDCEWTEEVHSIEVARDGTTTVLEVLDTFSDGSCAGRLPDGVTYPNSIDPGSINFQGDCGDAVARHLAHLAWLEGAAVIAFERLAIDLAHHGAPTDLIERARAAAQDEVDHASRMGALAARFGASVPAVDVAPHAQRSLFDVALENAVEGCVRETYGVVDALYRSTQAPRADIRALFALIADDETRHAELSWDISVWAQEHLSADESARIAAAAAAAQDDLATQLASERPDSVQQQLGAPPALAAVAMAQTLRTQLAA